MKALRIGRDAGNDLKDIWRYVASREGVAGPADAILDRLLDTFDLLATSPAIGKQQDQSRKGMRVFPVGNYLVYYRETSHGVVIMRVVHAARSKRKLFGVD
jgi:toxin ParE1/3/4